MIYADNAATTRLDEDAFEAMKPYLLEAYGNPSQPYAFARAPKKALREARETIAGCIGADADEIYFTSGGTEGDNWTVKGSAFSDPEKKAVITSAFEHHAILNACAAVGRMGYPVMYLRPERDGVVTADILKKSISGWPRFVSVMYANNEIGSVQPIGELCETAHAHGALFHSDAVQAVGHIPVDLHALGVDLLSASAHKFNGPKGVGFVYIRKGIDIFPHNDGGAQERGMRAGTENTAGIVGMAAALQKNCERMGETAQKLVRMEEILIDSLRGAGISFLRNGAAGEHLPGLLSLSFPGFEGEALLHRLDLMGICIATGAACDSRETRISHVLEAIGLDALHARGTVRVSFGRENDISDAEAVGRAIGKILVVSG
jgi:cysteine desulfurase